MAYKGYMFNAIDLAKSSYRTNKGNVTYPDWSERYSIVQCGTDLHVHEYVEACDTTVYLGVIVAECGK